MQGATRGNTMMTMHLGIEELLTHQHETAVRRSARHTWRLTDFWRKESLPQATAERVQTPRWAGELVEQGITQARWALV